MHFNSPNILEDVVFFLFMPHVRGKSDVHGTTLVMMDPNIGLRYIDKTFGKEISKL
jgi:hypothetical protein